MKTSYLDHLKPHFEFLLNERGFKVSGYEYPPKHFDNFYIDLASEDFLFRLLNDRGVCGSLVASTASNPTHWYDIGLLHSLIMGGDPTQTLTLDEEAEFIRTHYEAIKDALSVNNLSETSAHLKQIGHKRMAD